MFGLFKKKKSNKGFKYSLLRRTGSLCSTDSKFNTIDEVNSEINEWLIRWLLYGYIITNSETTHYPLLDRTERIYFLTLGDQSLVLTFIVCKEK